MDKKLLNIEVQNFINSNIENETTELAFSKNPFSDIKWVDILDQIRCKAKAKSKLPTYFNCQNILYPNKISLEQTSSEKTANYKAKIVFGKNLIDLTGGFGVDDLYFSKKVEKVFHCEVNSELHGVAKHNFTQLKCHNIECLLGDSSEILEKSQLFFDWIYLDPSRRNEVKGKVFLLQDCEPNIIVNIDFYFQKTKNILVKTSPMLDIASGLDQLKFVKEVHVLAVENEVKELLWVLEKNYIDNIVVKTINIQDTQAQQFDFNYSQRALCSKFSLPKKYLFEPNAAIMKAGAFDEVSVQFDIFKLHQNSQLYTNDIIIIFPGRIFEITANLEFNKSNMTKFLKNTKANITVRNFLQTVSEIRTNWKIKDGGAVYVFFTTDINNKKIFLMCKKVI